MTNHVEEITFTRASSKGQAIIPTKISKRFNIKEGSMLAVAAQKDVIVLKKIESGLSVGDLKSLKSVEKAWKDIEVGRYSVGSKKTFFKELKEW